jgi:hypothetical protein
MSLLMTFGSLRFGLNFAIFRKVHPFNYSDWQYVQALARVITEVIVIALKVHWSPKMLD